MRVTVFRASSVPRWPRLHPNVEIARQQLPAAMSMARLRRAQGKREEAGNLLAPVYGWFTEGFDTHDLKEAKTLLASLRT